MSDLLNPNPAPQFSIAEFGNEPKTDTCKMCQKPITATYYRANGAMICDSCADKVRRNIPQDSHAAFVKAVMFGVGGFLAGLIAYAGFSIVTGIQIGYLSLAVGWMVGKAMMIGSGNLGGRRYQIAAVALTYAAVSMAAIPIGLYYQSKIEGAQITGLAELGRMAINGLASPFLEIGQGTGGIIGLVILFVGMRFAWRMTSAKVSLAVEGPYQVSNPAAKGASA